jgi:hypothetical protein
MTCGRGLSSDISQDNKEAQYGTAMPGDKDHGSGPHKK